MLLDIFLGRTDFEAATTVDHPDKKYLFKAILVKKDSFFCLLATDPAHGFSHKFLELCF
jgi:hypothetical protein